jgi:glycine cleavage system aminomethyltransferase T/glycine/D-amino acid oxidase-like deaminating enzyme
MVDRECHHRAMDGPAPIAAPVPPPLPSSPLPTADLPSAASIVVIGAGIVGASTAYHLVKRGWRDVVLVDQGPIPATGGSTTHAPGGVFATNYARSMTRLALETVDLMASLDDDGAPCFYPVGTIELARTPERWEDHRRKLGVAASFGVPGARLLDPEETRALVPLIDPGEILGAYHVPIDGIAKPMRTVRAMLRAATGTAADALRLVPETRVTGFDIADGRVRGVHTTRGSVSTPLVVVAGGIWGPLLGELLGVAIPLIPCEHLYTITSPLASLAGETREVVHPMVRDQDRAMYYRQHADRYAVGSYQHTPLLVEPRAIRAHGSPAPAGTPSANMHGEAHDMPSLQPWPAEHFEPAWADARRLMPELATARLDYTLDGMFSFTPDGFPVLGEATSVRGAWVAEAVWLTHGGGVGRLMADWITDGEPGFDTHEMHIDRFETVQTSRAYVRARGARNYDEVYDLVHPLQPLGVARPLRVAPFHERLEELGAVFFEGKGFERAQWFETNRPDPSAARSGWAAQCWSASAATEHRAARERVAIFDLTSLTRAVVEGPDAEAFLQRMAASDLAGPVGSVVYTVLCTPAGGVRSDVTATRLAADRYQLGCNGPQDIAYLRRERRDDERVWITETTTGTTAVLVTGPAARALLQDVSPDDLSDAGFPYLTARPMEIDDVPVLAQRISYAGELGWELYTEAALGRRLWDVLWRAGHAHGLVPAGRAAYDGLRMEKGYRSWGLDMTEEDDPYEAGLGFTVRLGKGDFVGRDALAARKAAGRSRALAWAWLDDPADVVLGKEPVRAVGVGRDDEVVGYVRSAAYGYSVGHDLVSVMLPVGLAVPGTALTIEWFGRRLAATVVKDPVWDPTGERIRS